MKNSIKPLNCKSKNMNENFNQIIYELRKINSEIEKEYENFHSQTDSDLLEASIYRIKELYSRQSYLIKLAKRNNAEALYMKFNERVSVNNA